MLGVRCLEVEGSFPSALVATIDLLSIGDLFGASAFF